MGEEQGGRGDENCVRVRHLDTDGRRILKWVVETELLGPVDVILLV